MYQTVWRAYCVCGGGGLGFSNFFLSRFECIWFYFHFFQFWVGTYEAALIRSWHLRWKWSWNPLLRTVTLHYPSWHEESWDLYARTRGYACSRVYSMRDGVGEHETGEIKREGVREGDRDRGSRGNPTALSSFLMIHLWWYIYHDDTAHCNLKCLGRYQTLTRQDVKLGSQNGMFY